MKKTKTLLVIIFAMMMTVCLAVGTLFAANSGKGNLVATGDAENGDLGGLTAVTNEHYEGEHSFKVVNGTSIRLASPKTDGTYYVGSAMVKASKADSTFHIVVTATSQMADESWGYTYLDMWETKTIGTEWVEYTFSFWYQYDAENLRLTYFRGTGETVTVENVASPVAGFDFRFDTTGGDVYMDNFAIVETSKAVAGDLTAFGDAEADYTDFASRTLTASGEEAYNGFKSFKIENETQVRVTAPVANGTAYNGSMMIKGANTKITLIGVLVSQAGETYPTNYLDMWAQQTAENTWKEFKFNFTLSLDEDTKVLTIDRGAGAKVTVENIDSVAALEFVFRVVGTVYVDNLHITPEYKDPTEQYENAVKYFGFETDIEEFTEGYAGAGPCAYVTDEGETHNGSKGALRVKDLWTRKTSMDLGLFADGQIYTLYMYTKLAGEAATTANAYLYFWADNDKREDGYFDAYEQVEGALKLIEGASVSNDWTRVSATFGVYALDGKVYAYSKGGLTVLDDTIGADKVMAEMWAIDLGNYGGMVFYDDIALFASTVKGDAKVTVSGVEGAEIKVYKDGTLLAKQPEVTFAQGVYTVKDLKYSTLSETYTLSVEKDGGVIATRDVTYIKNEVSVSAVKYNAQITVEDTEGERITNATLTYGTTVLTENTDGVYSINDLDSNVVITVTAENKISQRITVTPEAATQTVALKAKKAETVVANNIVAQGTVEEGFTFEIVNKQGVEYAVTDEEQFDGEKALKLTSTQAEARTLFRIPALNENGTVYSLDAMVKGETTYAMGMMLTCSAVAGGYSYIAIQGANATLTDQWTLYHMTFSISYDEVTRKVTYTVNGGESITVDTEISSIAGFDLMLIMPENEKVVYCDNIVLLETYTATAKVLGNSGETLANATFEVEDYSGRVVFTPSYDAGTGVYTFVGLKGVTKIYATVGEKTYDAVTVSKTLTDVTIEESYTITLTLKDQNGAGVAGVNVIARKGITTVGTFTDNGDGTYTLAGVMGEVQVVATKDGYTFEKTTVSATNATLTVTGEKEETEQSSSKTSKGCMAVSFEAFALLSVVMAGAVLTLKKKN